MCVGFGNRCKDEIMCTEMVEKKTKVGEIAERTYLTIHLRLCITWYFKIAPIGGLVAMEFTDSKISCQVVGCGRLPSTT